jgi:hypothetical protein
MAKKILGKGAENDNLPPSPILGVDGCANRELPHLIFLWALRKKKGNNKPPEYLMQTFAGDDLLIS